MSHRVALVTTGAHAHLDDDLAPILEHLAGLDIDATVVDWHDDEFVWSSVELAVIRSTWDYTWQLDEFLVWAQMVATATRLANPLPVVGWNTDKRYLVQLAALGVPTVPTVVLEPGDLVGFPDAAEVVVKPVVSAGSRDTERYARSQLDAARQHVLSLHAAGRSVLVQPYLPAVDTAGESGLVFLGDEFSHAFRKGPLLHPGSTFVAGLYREEDITARVASSEELALAEVALDAVARCVPGHDRADLLYARVDVALDDGRPVVLELELVEPSLFCRTDPTSPARVAAAIARALDSLSG